MEVASHSLPGMPRAEVAETVRRVRGARSNSGAGDAEARSTGKLNRFIVDIYVVCFHVLTGNYLHRTSSRERPPNHGFADDCTGFDARSRVPAWFDPGTTTLCCSRHRVIFGAGWSSYTLS